MGLCASYGVGQYSSITTEAHVAIWDRMYVPAGTARSVLWFHSAGATTVGTACTEPVIASNNLLPLAQAIASLGLPILSADCGRDGTGGTSTVHWGNDTAQARASEMFSFVQTAPVLKASSGKAILVGESMGGLMALNWAKNNPTLVQAMVLLFPAVNLQAMHDATGGANSTYTASIETAYGGLAGFNAARPTHDPAYTGVPATYQSFPIYMGYGTADTVVGTANQTAWISVVGGSNLTTRSYSGATHGDTTKVDVADVASFVKQYV